MKLNRRNVLVGIGTAAVGSGVALGSGAFTQVEANRNVNLDVSDDSAALLELVADPDSEIVGTEDGGNAQVLNLDNVDLNENAVTTVAGGITVANQGGRDVGFYVEDPGSGNLGTGSELDFVESGGSSVVGIGNAVTLAANGGTTDLDVVIDTTGTNDPTNVGDVTFVADVDES